MSDSYTEFGSLNVSQQVAQEIAQRGFGVVNAGATDERLIVGFYRKSIVNPFRSNAEGKRICEDHDFVKIQHPGESLNIVDRPVSDSDKRRFPRQWAMFLQGKAQIPDGIPISLLYPDKPSITDTLTGYNIHTVEQLAALSGHGIQTVGMGCQEWVNKATKYLDQAQKGVDFHRFEQERKEKDQQISTLTRQVNELSAKLNQVLSKSEPPPKDFDVQTAQINAQQREYELPQAVTFTSSIKSPDLSGEVKQRGRPKGSRNKPKEA
jgi:hypothetical protein